MVLGLEVEVEVVGVVGVPACERSALSLGEGGGAADDGRVKGQNTGRQTHYSFVPSSLGSRWMGCQVGVEAEEVRVLWLMEDMTHTPTVGFLGFQKQKPCVLRERCPKSPLEYLSMLDPQATNSPFPWYAGGCCCVTDNHPNKGSLRKSTPRSLTGRLMLRAVPGAADFFGQMFQSADGRLDRDAALGW